MTLSAGSPLPDCAMTISGRLDGLDAAILLAQAILTDRATAGALTATDDLAAVLTAITAAVRRRGGLDLTVSALAPSAFRRTVQACRICGLSYIVRLPPVRGRICGSRTVWAPDMTDELVLPGFGDGADGLIQAQDILTMLRDDRRSDALSLLMQAADPSLRLPPALDAPPPLLTRLDALRLQGPTSVPFLPEAADQAPPHNATASPPGP